MFTRKGSTTKIVSMVVVGGATGCRLLQKVSLIGGHRDRVSETIAATPVPPNYLN